MIGESNQCIRSAIIKIKIHNLYIYQKLRANWKSDMNILMFQIRNKYIDIGYW